MSVAKNLVAGRILEDQLFPYIDSGSEDYSVEAAISKVFASEALQRSAYEALQDLGKSKIFTPMPQLLRGPAGIYEKYTVELAKASDFLLRKYGKSIADRQHALKRRRSPLRECLRNRRNGAWPTTFAEPSGMRTRR